MECPKCGTDIPEGKLYCPSCGYAVQIVPDYDADLEDNLDSASSDIAGTVNRIDVSDSTTAEYDIDATTREIPMVKKDEASGIKRKNEQNRERTDQITTVIMAGLLLIVLIVVAVVASKSLSGVSFIPEQAVENAVTANMSGKNNKAADEEMTEEAPAGNMDETVSEDSTEQAPLHNWQLVATPASGSYTGPQRLTVTVSDNAAPESAEFKGIIYYTEDGSDPDEKSKVYRGDNEMWLPLGKSKYAFRFMDENGNMSDPVYLDYDMGSSGVCTAADAANYCIVNLIQAGVLADVYGHVIGSLGTFTYEPVRMVNSGNGSFYVINEYYTDPGGTPKATGNVYAIDADNLGFYRAKQGSNGNFVFETFF